MKLAPLVLACLLLGNCTSVKPYERELLAQPGMSFEPTPDTESEQHMLEAREASRGGYGAAGGGCGCN